MDQTATAEAPQVAQETPTHVRKGWPKGTPRKPKVETPTVSAAGPLPPAEGSIITSPDILAVTFPGAKRVGESNVVEMGMEGLSANQTLNPFTPHKEFDLTKMCAAYATTNANEITGWPSIAELQRPKQYPEIRMVHPGWRIWTDSQGKPFILEYAGRKLTLMYSDRRDMDVINKALGKLSRDGIKMLYNSARQTERGIPGTTQDSQDREDETIRQQLEALEQAGQLQVAV